MNGSSSSPVNAMDAAIASSNSAKYDEFGPNGYVKWKMKPGANPSVPMPGDYIRETQFSPNQSTAHNMAESQQIRALQAADIALSNQGQEHNKVGSALYNRATPYYDERFASNERALRSQLLNSGLNEGSAAYKNSMNDFNYQKNAAYADATDRAVAGSDAYLNNSTQRIAQLLAMGKGQAPQSMNSAGGAAIDFSNAAAQHNQQILSEDNAANAQNQMLISSGAGLAAMLF